MEEGEIVNLTSALTSPSVFCSVRCQKHPRAYMEGSLATTHAEATKNRETKALPLSTSYSLKTNDIFSYQSF